MKSRHPVALVYSFMSTPEEFREKPLNILDDLLRGLKGRQNIHTNRLKKYFIRDNCPLIESKLHYHSRIL